MNPLKINIPKFSILINKKEDYKSTIKQGIFNQKQVGGETCV